MDAKSTRNISILPTSYTKYVLKYLINLDRYYTDKIILRKHVLWESQEITHRIWLSSIIYDSIIT